VWPDEPRELHGQGRAALRETPRFQVVKEGAAESEDVYAVMGEEAAILLDNESLPDVWRQLAQMRRRCVAFAAGGKLSQERAVACFDAQRDGAIQRKLGGRDGAGSAERESRRAET